MKRGIIALLTAGMLVASGLAAVTTAPQAACAKPDKKQAKPVLNEILGKLKWGMSGEQAKKIIAAKIMDDFSKKIEGNNDLSFADNIRKVYTKRIENMQKSHIVLTRENSSNLGVSIVGEEFMPDKNESLITERDDVSTKYYFFENDKLYKVALVYDSSYIGPLAFDSFCTQTSKKYGPAKKEVWDDEGNFNESVWTDKTDVKLIIKNKYQSYSTFLMVFVDDGVESRLQKEHKDYYASLSAGPDVSSTIDALTEDDDDAGGSSIDAILGTKTEVNLLSGLSQEDVDFINGKDVEEEEEAEEGKKKKKAKKSKPKKKPKKNLSVF